MKPAEAPTLSAHLLHEAARFFIYPAKVYRSKLNLMTQKVLEDGVKRFLEWRRTFAPREDWPAEFLTEQMLDQNLIDDVAARGQVLSKEGRSRAHIVREAGNAVLHDEPASDALAVLEAARDVIMLLHRK